MYNTFERKRYISYSSNNIRNEEKNNGITIFKYFCVKLNLIKFLVEFILCRKDIQLEY